MVRVRTYRVSCAGQGCEAFVEVAFERDRDVRSPEGRPDLEPSYLEIFNQVAAEPRKSFELVGTQVVDLSLIASVERREAPSTPVGEPTAKRLSLMARGYWVEVVAPDDEDGIIG